MKVSFESMRLLNLVDKGIFKRPDNDFLLTNHQKPAPNFDFAKIDNAEAEPTNA